MESQYYHNASQIQHFLVAVFESKEFDFQKFEWFMSYDSWV